VGAIDIEPPTHSSERLGSIIFSDKAV